MIAKHGSEEAWKDAMRARALKAQESWVKNGKKPRGFAHENVDAHIEGAKGGRASRRGKVVK